MPEFMFVKVEDIPTEEKTISFVKNENGEIVPRVTEELKSQAEERSEATAEPILGSEPAYPEEEIDKRYQRFLRMSESERDTLTCDDAFVLYLGDVSKYVNPTYYKTVLRFIILFRECLNDLGWQKRREQYQKSDLETDDLYQRIKEKEMTDPEATKNDFQMKKYRKTEEQKDEEEDQEAEENEEEYGEEEMEEQGEEGENEMFEGEFGEDEMEEMEDELEEGEMPKDQSNADMTENEGGEKESDLEEGEMAASDAEADMSMIDKQKGDLSINDKLQLEIQNQIDLKQQELLESEAKVRELNNIPLRENKELIQRVEEQQRL